MTLDTFETAYVNALMFSSPDGDLYQGHSIGMIDADTLHQCSIDCEAFQRLHAVDLERADCHYGRGDSDCGHDFALSRNGHGAGFFDRDMGATGDRLQDAARAFGEYNLFLQDDGIIEGIGG